MQIHTPTHIHIKTNTTHTQTNIHTKNAHINTHEHTNTHKTNTHKKGKPTQNKLTYKQTHKHTHTHKKTHTHSRYIYTWTDWSPSTASVLPFPSTAFPQSISPFPSLFPSKLISLSLSQSSCPLPGSFYPSHPFLSPNSISILVFSSCLIVSSLLIGF